LGYVHLYNPKLFGKQEKKIGDKKMMKRSVSPRKVRMNGLRSEAKDSRSKAIEEQAGKEPKVYEPCEVKRTEEVSEVLGTEDLGSMKQPSEEDLIRDPKKAFDKIDKRAS
jgi:hypothetical protein